MRIVFATGNKDKMREIRQIFGSLGMEVVSMKEADADVDVEENGTTFAENSMIKARAVAKCLSDKGDHDSIVLADDSGLEIDYLNGEPGIYSHRFAGENATDEDRFKKILKLLENVPDEKRGCHFTCSMCYIDKKGEKHFFEDYLYGKIGTGPKGNNGVGYDPIVYLHDGKAVAELTPEQKNKISHRGKCVQQLVKYIKENGI